MHLENIKTIKGRLVLVTGLRVGAGNSEMHIGGADNTVVRHPHTEQRYIPGSSIKGKVRSLLETASGLMAHTGGKPLDAGTIKKLTATDKEKCETILRLFGCSGASEAGDLKLGPTRLSFSDCFLNKKWLEKARENRWPFVEVKSENSIDRIKGTALNPRQTERVPAGAEFDFSIHLKVFEGDSEKLEKCLIDGLKLLEMDAMGGCGSRGYGRVSIEFEDATLRAALDKSTPFAKV